MINPFNVVYDYLFTVKALPNEDFVEVLREIEGEKKILKTIPDEKILKTIPDEKILKSKASTIIHLRFFKKTKSSKKPRKYWCTIKDKPISKRTHNGPKIIFQPPQFKK